VVTRKGDNMYNNKEIVEKTKSLIEFGSGFPAQIDGSGWLDSQGHIDKKRGIETWITSRMTHSFSLVQLLSDNRRFNADSKLSEQVRNEQILFFLESGYHGLVGPLRDVTNGGWYSKIDWDGEVVNEAKEAYAHAFVILGSSSLVLATSGINRVKSARLLSCALKIFDKYFWDEKYGMSVDNYPKADWSKKDSYRGINANMHTVEAFLATYDVLKILAAENKANNSVYYSVITDNGKVNQNLYEALGFDLEEKAYDLLNRVNRIVDRVCFQAKSHGWRIPEHYKENWEPDLEYNSDNKDDKFKPYGATVGHGIEWARLITQFALKLPKKQREKYFQTAQNLFKVAVDDGWDKKIGGFIYTTDWEGNPIVKDRMHWVEAEALNTASTLLQFCATEDQEKYYTKWFNLVWKWTKEHLLDETGSWIHQLDENNQISETVWPGKPDVYHALQSYLIPIFSKNFAIASAIKLDI
jgi:mannose/cellobiose epimerase-like protein (N-acyl-D-glucosamine 2-epimerase family)